MENTETKIQKEESTTVVPDVTEEKPTETVPIVNAETSTTETTPIVNGETSTTETTPIVNEEKSVTETVEKNEESSTTTKSTDEQENVTDTPATVPSASLSPGRANIPLKEVNESEKEEPAVLPNGVENGISKKRELEQEDEVTAETSTDNDDRNGLDQSKKIKISEAIDTPVIETKELEKNIIVNGNTAVEV